MDEVNYHIIGVSFQLWKYILLHVKSMRRVFAFLNFRKSAKVMCAGSPLSIHTISTSRPQNIVIFLLVGQKKKHWELACRNDRWCTPSFSPYFVFYFLSFSCIVIWQRNFWTEILICRMFSLLIKESKKVAWFTLLVGRNTFPTSEKVACRLWLSN